MPAPTITPLPTPPSRSTDPANFATEADAFVAALPTWTTEANAQAAYLNDAAEAAEIAVAMANYQGEYNGATAYLKGQSVSYNGLRYMAKQNTTGNLPTNQTFWFAIDVFSSPIAAVAALDIDCTLGNFFTKTINANSVFTFSNAPSDKAFSFVLELTHTSGTVTWPASVRWVQGSTPALETGKVHLFIFLTDDAGTIWRGSALLNYTS